MPEGAVGNACERHEQCLKMRADPVLPAAVSETRACSVDIPALARARVLRHRKGAPGRIKRDVEEWIVQAVVAHGGMRCCLHNKRRLAVRIAGEAILHQ